MSIREGFKKGDAKYLGGRKGSMVRKISPSRNRLRTPWKEVGKGDRASRRKGWIREI